MKVIGKELDTRAVISRGDLHYHETVDISDEGLPLGNGAMGSLVWTSPWSVKLQINRIDVYASNASSQSFNQRNSDYSLGCAIVDIDLGRGPEEVFPKSETEQHLSIYDGLVTVTGSNVTVKIVSSQNSDAFVFQVEDLRATPQPVTVKLRMLRPSEVYERNHQAIASCEGGEEVISLRQVFREDTYYCSSAVSATASGGEVFTRYLDETGGKAKSHSSEKIPGIGITLESEISLTVKPGASASRQMVIASAASFDSGSDTVKEATRIAVETAALGFDHVRAAAAAWWEEFWSGGYVLLGSEDGEAEMVQAHYTYFLYIMACCARGTYAPRYGCLLFSTHGDKRAWGAQQWWTNVSLYYRGLFPTGKLELFNGFFDQYFRVKESCAQAAHQQWGSKGIYYPETMWFDGLASLPDDIAEEMRDLYLCRKPWESRSSRFDEYASVRHPHSSRWNWIGHGTWIDGVWTYGYNAVPPFSPVNHFFASGGEIAMLFWKNYEYTRDITWLKEIGYPVISGVADFLSSFPNFIKEDDGEYHVNHVNQGEHVCGGRDTFDYLCAVKGVLPVAARAAHILGVDEERRSEWMEIARNTASLPTSEDPDSFAPGKPGESTRFVDARNPVVYGKPRPGVDEFNSRYYDYDLINLESAEADATAFETARNTFAFGYPDGVSSETPVRVMSSLPIIAAKLGRRTDFKHAVVNIIRVLDPAFDYCDFEGQGSRGVLPNRMTNREGVNAIGAQRLGSTVYAVNEALCQSDPAGPGEKAVIRLFPAWPREWDAQFSLRVRGGFSVTSAMRGGVISSVVVAPEASNCDGEICLRNPWPGKRVSIERLNGNADVMDGDVLIIPMDGEIAVSPAPDQSADI